MSPGRPSVEQVFFAAAPLTARSRAALLERQCAGDGALRREVESLLAEHDAGAAFLESPPVELIGDDDSSVSPGERIGAYRLERLLGQGGMGAVYLAHQEHPIQRRVALKLLAPGWSGAEVLARFAAERQALAMLDHPGVARVLDAGVTPAGRPYFVMDLVEGQIITEYCRDRAISLEGRVVLMIAVSEAVHHAHQKGIIHRDLKPANILVEDRPGASVHNATKAASAPTPKIIDFGVAKLVSELAGARDATTQAGEMLGTPEYMSPEQAAGTAAGVDIRTDVYSLGLVMYELLVGAPAVDGRVLRAAGLAEMLRVLRDVDPAPPSERAAILGVATARSLRGDLDRIVMKAIDKDRERRYASAMEMADDLRRHLAHLPVRARPPSTLYVLGRFVRRRRGVVVAIGAVIGTLAIGLGAALHSSREARLAGDMANARYDRILITINEITEFAGTTLANIAGGSGAAAATADTALDRLRTLDARGGSDPLREQVMAYALQRAGECRLVAGQTAAALALFEQSVGVRAQSAATTPDPVLERSLGVGWLKIAEAQMRMGRASDALGSARRAMEIFWSIDDRIGWRPAIRNVYLGRAHRSIGEALADLGQRDDAMASLLTALELYRDGLGTEADNLVLARGHATTLRDLADVLAAAGRMADAHAGYQEAIAAASALSARTGPMNVWERTGLARCRLGLSRLLLIQGEFIAAEAEARAAADLAGSLSGADPQNAESQLLMVQTRLALAAAIQRAGRSGDARAVLDATGPAARMLSRADPDNALASRAVRDLEDLAARER